jgi:hypothetical protein
VCTCVCESVLMKTVGRFGNPHSPCGGAEWGGVVQLYSRCSEWVGCGVWGLRYVCTVWYSSRSRGSQCVTLCFFLFGVGSGVFLPTPPVESPRILKLHFARKVDTKKTSE